MRANSPSWAGTSLRGIISEIFCASNSSPLDKTNKTTNVESSSRKSQQRHQQLSGSDLT